VSLLQLGGEPQRSGALVRRAGALELCGGPNSSAPQWRIALESLVRLAEDTAILLATRHPERAAGELASLARSGDDVLALSGARGQLVRVDPTSGELHARLDVPWEVERGFIGPSVWSRNSSDLARTSFSSAVLRPNNSPHCAARPNNASSAGSSAGSSAAHS